MTDQPRFASVFAELESSGQLEPQLVERVFDSILAGEWTPIQVAGLMVALRLKGETPETIAHAATALRKAMVPVEHDLPCVVDTAGTGGDGFGSVNLSTGAALLVAAAGIPVAKHGNRAVSSKAGSADVLEALGVRLDVTPADATRLLREVGITFMMAPRHHPAMRHAVAARKELGIRTLFNCLGPLANPARATHQLLGAYDRRLLEVLAHTLRKLGCQRAWVVRGDDGLDEVSPCSTTAVVELASDGSLRQLEVCPEDFGLRRLDREAIQGGDASFNADVIRRVSSGEDHPSRDAFILNAAATLVVAREIAPKEATEQVREVLRSGAASTLLERWRSAQAEG